MNESIFAERAFPGWTGILPAAGRRPDHQGVEALPPEMIDFSHEDENRLDITFARRSIGKCQGRRRPNHVTAQPVLRQYSAALLEQPISRSSSRLILLQLQLKIRFFKQGHFDRQLYLMGFAPSESLHSFVKGGPTRSCARFNRRSTMPLLTLAIGTGPKAIGAPYPSKCPSNRRTNASQTAKASSGCFISANMSPL